MKDQKLIYAMKNIDDDLISEAMKRRSADTEQKGEEAVNVSVVRKRRGQVWKYSVVAAALLGVMGVSLFVINNMNGVPDSFSSSENVAGTDEVTVETQEGAVSSTEPNVTETAITQVTPIKVVDIQDPNSFYASFFKVICVDSLPTVSNPTLKEECFTEMSTEELFKYYGLDFMLPKLISSDVYHEVRDENTVHGIYTLPDGSVEDINTFHYVSENTDGRIPGFYFECCSEFTITVGKETKFGKEFNFKSEPFTHNRICYNEEDDAFFVVYDVKGVCSVMVSAKTDYTVYSDKMNYLSEFLELNDGISPFSKLFRQTLFNLFTTRIELTSEELLGQEPYESGLHFREIDEVTGEERIN